MPKEYVHWVFAEKIFLQSPEKVKGIINLNKDLYYLGAIAPDTPYYYLRGDEKESFRKAADFAHGRYKNNTLGFLTRIFDSYHHNLTDEMWAFLLGVVTHVFTDSTMHPVVFHFCGDPKNKNPKIYTNAHIRHRVFESWLDIKYQQEFPLSNKGKYKISYKKLGSKKELFLQLLNLYLFI